MSDMRFVKSQIGDENHHWFQSLVSQLYTANSPRFVLGFDPVSKYLEACYTLLHNDLAVGRFAFYENPELKFQGKKAACIGSYECVDDPLISSELLKFARELAVSKGYQFLLGPMEGSTWNNYRFHLVNENSPFFMEPYHHAYYVDQFRQAGFNEIAEYRSNRGSTLVFDDTKLAEYESLQLENGIVIRKIDLTNFEGELYKIGKLSVDGFSNNFLYTPISVDEFVQKYLPIKAYLDPDFIYMMEDQDSDLQAFVFAVKDHGDLTGETMIVKSMVKKADCNIKGMGNYLSGKMVQIANQKGYKYVIHAYMIHDNTSNVFSKNYEGDFFKSYALFGMSL